MNESSQPHFEELISAYLDGELSGDELQSVEELLRDNAELRQVYEELRSLRGVLQSLPRHTLDDDFYKRVLDRAEVHRDDSSPPQLGGIVTPPPQSLSQVTRPRNNSDALRSSWRRGLFWGVASCAAAVALLLVSFPQMRDMARAPRSSTGTVAESETAWPDSSTAAQREAGADRRSRGASEASAFSDDESPVAESTSDGAATFSKGGTTPSRGELTKGGIASPNPARAAVRDHAVRDHAVPAPPVPAQLPDQMMASVPSEHELPDWLLRTAVDQNVDYIVQIDSNEGEQAIDEVNRALVANSIVYDVEAEKKDMSLSYAQQTSQPTDQDATWDVGLVSVEGSTEQVIQTIRDIQRNTRSRSVVQVRVAAGESQQLANSYAPAQATSVPNQYQFEPNTAEQRSLDSEEALATSDSAEQVANAPSQVASAEGVSQSRRFVQTPDNRAMFRNMAVTPRFGEERLNREAPASAPSEVSDAAAQVAQEYVESPVTDNGLASLGDRRLQEEQPANSALATDAVPAASSGPESRPEPDGAAAVADNRSGAETSDLGLATERTEESQFDDTVDSETSNWNDKFLRNYNSITRDRLAEAQTDQLWVAPQQGRAWFVVPQAGERQLESYDENADNQVNGFAGGGGAQIAGPSDPDPALQAPAGEQPVDMPRPDSIAPNNNIQQDAFAGNNLWGRNVRALIVLRKGLPASQFAQEQQSLGATIPPVAAEPSSPGIEPAAPVPSDAEQLEQQRELPVPAESIPTGEPGIP
jgi:anti-sigma factor RsiW